MALENVQHIHWPEGKSQFFNPLISDVILEISSEDAATHIAVLLETIESLDCSAFSLAVLTHNNLLTSFPDSINVVSTLQEAYDVIEMERIERDLGF